MPPRRLFPYNRALLAIEFNQAITLNAAKENLILVQTSLIEGHRRALQRNEGKIVPILLLCYNAEEDDEEDAEEDDEEDAEEDATEAYWKVVHVNEERNTVYFDREHETWEDFNISTAIFTCLPYQCYGDIEWQMDATEYNSNDYDSVPSIIQDMARDKHAQFVENTLRIENIAEAGKDDDKERPRNTANINPMVLVMLNIHHQRIVPYFILGKYYRKNDVLDSAVPDSVPTNYEGVPPPDLCFSFFAAPETPG